MGHRCGLRQRHCPEGRAGLHTFTNPTQEPARILAVSAGRYPDGVAYPEQGLVPARPCGARVEVFVRSSASFA